MLFVQSSLQFKLQDPQNASKFQALGQTFYNNLFRENPVLRNQFNMSNQRTNAQASGKTWHAGLIGSKQKLKFRVLLWPMRWLPSVATVTSLRLWDLPLSSINSFRTRPPKKKRIDRKYTVIPTRVANRHVSLEVTPDQYNVVGGTLLASLEVVWSWFL